MPSPTEHGRRYVPGLDGLRAVAVACVIAYHLGASWAPGGMLGVGIFFTLSGYLITDILMAQWRRHGNLGLKTFWRRRARRLLPALFVMLAVVSVWVALFDVAELSKVRGQVIAAVFYVSNWYTIAQHGSYFARFANPLPLDHLWSLAIEEQFYLVWPWLLGIGIWVARSRTRLALMTLGGAAISMWLMAHLYHPGYDPTRVYEGTDTRAFALLIGAAMAIQWPSTTAAKGARLPIRNGLDVLGGAGLIGALVLVWRTGTFSHFLYPWGFFLLSLCTVAMIAAVAVPSTLFGLLMGARPLRWIGVRSYGIYLWQWPIIVLTAPSHGGIPLTTSLLDVVATLVIAAVSWRFIEDPIRHGALVRLSRRLRSEAKRVNTRRVALTASSVAVVAVLLPISGLVGLLPTASTGQTTGSPNLIPVAPASLGPFPPALHLAAVTRTAQRLTHFSYPKDSSCRSVVYIGDSTSEGETSTNYIPNPKLRLDAQLAKVGVRSFYPEISGARSIVETYQNFPNAATVAQNHISAGFRGCWILALGTNEVADVNTGSSVGLEQRIDRMMKIIGNQPVLWIEAMTILGSGAYRESGMQAWNRDVIAACKRYPNLRVFDWPHHVKRSYFIPDGIHYYSPGYVARSHVFARALADAFPAHGPAAPTCLII
jgi:peptidoglycan/LPS O-acetylase OafA/YrhL